MMKRRSFILGLLILGLLLLTMVCYRVTYHEAAVVTTFGRVDASGVRNADGKGAGLYFKLPWPIQEVARTYDTRVQVLEDRLEEQQTLDKQNIIVTAFVSWRVSDPLAFYRTLNNFDQAERQMRDRLRDARAKIGEYTFDQLHNTDPVQNKLSELEEALRERVQSELTRQGYGVQIAGVEVKRTLLAEAVTQKVFDRMRSTRERLAQRARSEGDAAASDIRAKANSAQQRILAFAERRAQAIRAEGDAAAAEQYKVFVANEDFAIFLRKLEEYRKILSNNTTFLLDARSGPFDLFANPPGNAPAPTASAASNKPESAAAGIAAGIKE